MVLIKHRPVWNEEALADPNYNPEIDPKVVRLYNMMAPTDDNPDSAELLQEYEEQFKALPTKNIYSAVLVNPRQCDITELRDRLAEYKTCTTTIYGKLSPGDKVTWDTQYPTIDADIVECEQTLTELETHTNRLTANLPTLVGMAQGALGVATVLAALANPCAGVGNFFGSLMDKGKQLLNDIRAKVDGLVDQLSIWANGAMAAVQSMLDFIKNGIDSIMSGIADVANMIADEIAAFANSLIGDLRMGLADFLKAMQVDPCMKALLGGAVTGAAAAILG